MRLYFELLAAVALAVCSITSGNIPIKTIKDIEPSEEWHGPVTGIDFGKVLISPGNMYSRSTDVEGVVPGMEVTSAWVQGRVHVGGVGFTTIYPDGTNHSTAAGVDEGDVQRLTLDKGEYITKVRWSTNEHEGKTRLSFLELTTNNGRVVFGGNNKTDRSQLDEENSPEYYQLGTMWNVVGNGVEHLMAAYTCVQKRCTSFHETRVG